MSRLVATWVASTGVLAVLLGGCSSGAGRPAPHSSATVLAPTPSLATNSPSPQPRLLAVPCSRRLRSAFARAAGTSAVTAHAEVATGLTRCIFRARPRHAAGCTAAAVSIDTAADVLTDFDRWVAESAQNAVADPGGHLAPRQIDGIGLLADWVPGTLTFEAATQLRWVAVYLSCPGQPARYLDLGEELARRALAAS